MNFRDMPTGTADNEAEMTKDAPRDTGNAALSELDSRSRDIFRRIVEGYLETGEPMGSRNISKILPVSHSAATVRNVMQDLEDLGLVYARHISAGRLPTEQGLRLLASAPAVSLPSVPPRLGEELALALAASEGEDRVAAAADEAHVLDAEKLTVYRVALELQCMANTLVPSVNRVLRDQFERASLALF